ncbi:MAG TPA: LOG family protein, partial [Spirochaetia bacterium]
MRICVYCSSSDAVDGAYTAAARELGTLIGRDGHTLVYGGGSVGLMGATARAAHAAGGRVIGIIPRFMDKPGVPYRECDELTWVETMPERKTRMIAIA